MKSGFLAAVAAALMSLTSTSAARADDLLRSWRWANVASDQKAAEVGDTLTVIVAQTAEARNEAQSDARRRRALEGRVSSGARSEGGSLALDGDFAGRGGARRSESFVTQISVTVREVLPNGDLAIAGDQRMHINGETTTIEVRGRVRQIDITGDNRVLSTSIADAQINYRGEGFVSRNAGSGPLDWLFGWLGLGG